MSQPIRGQGDHLVFPIGSKNTNLVEDGENLIASWQVKYWLVVLRIYVASAVFQPYRDLDAGDNQSPNLWKFKCRGRESKPGPLAPQAKSLY